MPPEIALVESRALSGSVVHRIEAIDKVKVLTMLPDGTYVTTRMVADYFEVGERAINALSLRHREELEANGYRILRGVDKSRFVSCNMKFTQVSGGSIAVYDRRAVLNVAMLLRDSDVARQVRSYLLDAEERVVHRPRRRAPGSALRHAARSAARPRSALGRVRSQVDGLADDVRVVRQDVRSLRADARRSPRRHRNNDG